MVGIPRSRQFKEKLSQKIRNVQLNIKKHHKLGHIKSPAMTIGQMDVINKLKESDGRCPLCQCEILLDDFEPHCVYQWSIGRIHYQQQYSPENLVIMCMACNMNYCKKAEKTTCVHGCHMGIERRLQGNAETG